MSKFIPHPTAEMAEGGKGTAVVPSGQREWNAAPFCLIFPCQ